LIEALRTEGRRQASSRTRPLGAAAHAGHASTAHAGSATTPEPDSDWEEEEEEEVAERAGGRKRRRSGLRAAAGQPAQWQQRQQQDEAEEQQLLVQAGENPLGVGVAPAADGAQQLSVPTAVQDAASTVPQPVVVQRATVKGPSPPRQLHSG